MAQSFVQQEALRARACQLVKLPHTSSPKICQIFLRVANKPLGPDCDQGLREPQISRVWGWPASMLERVEIQHQCGLALAARRETVSVAASG